MILVSAYPRSILKRNNHKTDPVIEGDHIGKVIECRQLKMGALIASQTENGLNLLTIKSILNSVAPT